MNISQELEEYKKQYFSELNTITNEKELDAFKIKHLSRHGELSSFVDKLKELTVDEKREFGLKLNQFKKEAQEAFDQKKQEILEKQESIKSFKELHFDVTASKVTSHGTLHPYTKTVEQIEDIFISMGYEIQDGPEVETEFHNFDALNIPEDHPARDIQDTFWLTLPKLLMRTHTSNVQIHSMLVKKPPIAIVAPGRCYRNEATDASHDFMFMQVEGLLIDKNISLGNLFATTQNFLQAIFEKKDLKIRMRPGYFPFVEPGLEIDMSCPFCTQGCSVCKKTKWIEICGAGLIHPNVLRAGNINPEEYSGFAFGFGLTRLVMLKYNITDIRLLHSNKIDFLNQF